MRSPSRSRSPSPADRHAFLHALAYEFAEEFHATLTGRQAAGTDAAAYRARLRAL
jgi:hypothetical protein